MTPAPRSRIAPAREDHVCVCIYIYIILYIYIHINLVGGYNPSEKYARQNGFIFPNFRGENKKKWVATLSLYII